MLSNGRKILIYYLKNLKFEHKINIFAIVLHNYKTD